ncbi:NAD(P)H-dependent oxidoreductase [Nocardioides zeae]|uniref:NAD(P)H-dependent oxidoreductase n=1 Tax=Nocardioides imazamoxiresistens TaxID=3231893 RepID=A0ABU3PQD6_9ACTN|nr:NAD(P)H-dependent oxidoreductase [Nocardioides zeae]MDT9591440.1 NAD(P)H-dependent oxidoreductase [Nocardioides zeae]
MTLRALQLTCTLKPSPAPSSSQKLGNELLAELASRGVETEEVRIVDHHVAFGVTTDEGTGPDGRVDEWPTIRERVLAADILVLSTPIWMGQPSAVCKMVLERLDAETAETDEDGLPTMLGKVALVAVVGNEDGAHHTSAELFQALNDVGFTVPAQGATYWVGEAMQGTDYNDLDASPDPVASTTRTAAQRAVHVASLLTSEPYPAPPE